MTNIIVYSSLLFLLFVIYMRSKSNNTLGIALLSLYLISALTSIMHYQNYSNEYPSINLTSFVYLFVALYIHFYAILRFPQKQYINIKDQHLPIKTISLCFICMYIPAVLLSFTNALSNIDAFMVDYAVASEVYHDTADSVKKVGGPINVFSVFCNVFSDIMIFWTIYYSALYYRKNRILIILLLICILDPLLNGIINSGRGGMIRWMIQMIISVLIFRPFCTTKTKKLLTRIVVICGVLLIIPVTLITLGRFATGMRDNDDAVESIVQYLGEPSLNFNNYILHNEVNQYGDGTMPLFRKILGLEYSENAFERHAKWLNKMHIPQHIFYTFIGDFVNDYGAIFVLIFSIIISAIIYKGTRVRGNAIPLHNLFLLYFFCCICFNGMFYFSYKTIGGNLKLIVNICFYLFLYLMYIKNNTYHVNSKIYSILPSPISSNSRK